MSAIVNFYLFFSFYYFTGFIEVNSFELNTYPKSFKLIDAKHKTNKKLSNWYFRTLDFQITKLIKKNEYSKSGRSLLVTTHIKILFSYSNFILFYELKFSGYFQRIHST